jgi:hypothetical protein
MDKKTRIFTKICKCKYYVAIINYNTALLFKLRQSIVSLIKVKLHPSIGELMLARGVRTLPVVPFGITQPGADPESPAFLSILVETS